MFKQSNTVLDLATSSVQSQLQAPPLSLDYVKTITDDTGMLQHAVGGVPDAQHGYTTDDNCRALLAMTRLWRTNPILRSEADILLRIYARFMLMAQVRGGENAGWFINFFGYNRNPLEPRGTEDCLGRCIWALGECAGGKLPSGVLLAIRQMLGAARSNLKDVGSPHAHAYALIGLSFLPGAGDDSQVIDSAEFLKRHWYEFSRAGWHWFEPQMTYDNARCVEAMLRAGLVTGNKEYLQIGTDALEFLTENSFDSQNGHLCPVGNKSWWTPTIEKCQFDQQTIEAGAYAELYHFVSYAFGLTQYLEFSNRSRDWFHGDNVHKLPIYCPDTGGCYDALTQDGVNLNQGAESVLSYILAETACTADVDQLLNYR